MIGGRDDINAVDQDRRGSDEVRVLRLRVGLDLPQSDGRAAQADVSQRRP